MRLPLTRREARLRVTVNRAVTFDETLEVPEPIVAAPVAVARAAPPSVQVEVIREAWPFHPPADDEVLTNEE